MSLVIGAFTMGLILSLLSLGMLISFRMIKFTDITVDGSITLGAALAAVLITQGWSPWIATLMAFLAGSLAGMITGILHTKFKIQMILAGILMMTALYSVNLRIMGRSNIPLLDTGTVSSGIEAIFGMSGNESGGVNVLGWIISFTDLAVFVHSLLFCIITGILLTLFLRTHFGTALRATGNNAQMVRAQGINNNVMVVFGLALSNGLVALSGALLAQFQGFADVQMGIGMMVWGLASVIIGEALVGRRSIGLAITGAVLGTILFRLLIAIALRWGLNPNDLKLVTAIFVFLALVTPSWMKKIGESLFGGTRHA
ncbi:MAG TPA: ABC transporter permease [Bacteroidales bacterium]|nr:ABC transporter permease [Bacteroidales bacterium]HRW96835.1 ABC transporter permease [Bacteroidales bacterium]